MVFFGAALILAVHDSTALSTAARAFTLVGPAAGLLGSLLLLRHGPAA